MTVFGRLADGREVGDLAVVLEVGRLEQRRTLDARVVGGVVVAALHAGAIARVGQVAIAAAADVVGSLRNVKLTESLRVGVHVPFA